MIKKILSIIIIILVSLGLGILIGTKIKKIPAPSGTENTYQAGWDAARERLGQSSYGMVALAEIEIRSINGAIEKINGNKLTVKITPLEPLADPSLDVRMVTVDSNTKFFLNVQKDPTQFQKEMQEFQDKMTQPQQQDSLSGQAAQAPAQIEPPMPFEKRDIKLSDLKENQQITVVANEDIKDKKDFAAIDIYAQDTAPAQDYTPSIPLPPTEAPAPIAPASADDSTPAVSAPVAATEVAPVATVPAVPVKTPVN